MSKLAHCCEQFLRELELPAASPAMCPTCKNQIMFDVVQNENARAHGPVIREMPEDESYMVSDPEYLEKEVTISTKEYEIGNEGDTAAIQRNVLSQYLREHPVFNDKRYRNSVSIIHSGARAKALAKTAIVS
jgi:hypothetical protein